MKYIFFVDRHVPYIPVFYAYVDPLEFSIMTNIILLLVIVLTSAASPVCLPFLCVAFSILFYQLL